MNFLDYALKQTESYKFLNAAVKGRRFPMLATGLSRIHQANLIFSLLHNKNATAGKALIIVSDENEASKLKDDLTAMDINTLIFAARDLYFRGIESVSREYERMRIGVLSKMLANDWEAVIATVDGAAMLTAHPDILKKHSFKIKIGSEINIEHIINMLISSGYQRTGSVEATGQFAVRGGILDVFTPDGTAPVRIEFWGNSVDSMGYFDIASQRRTENIKSLLITPACEVLFESVDDFTKKAEIFSKKLHIKHEKVRQNVQKDIDRIKSGLHLTNADKYIPLLNPKTIFDYINDDTMIFCLDHARISERMKSFYWQQSEDQKTLFEDGILTKGIDKFTLSGTELWKILENRKTVVMESFSSKSVPVKLRDLTSFSLKQIPPFSGMTAELAEDIKPFLSRGFGLAILAGTERGAAALCENLRKQGISASVQNNPDIIEKNHVFVTKGTLSAGIEYGDAKLAVFTHSAVSASKVRKITKVKKANAFNSLEELVKGNYVVHSVHGIGIFEGIHNIKTEGVIKDYIKIRYLRDDILYVPVTQLDLVSRYIGANEDNVKINKLGTPVWQNQKKRVKAAVKDMAKQLIALYSKRMNSKGFAFSKDDELQNDFENRFPYEETDDQLVAASEIKKDMRRSVPMDRLLCGDVGFGKTEVALRAAFRCIADGKQCAFLVPTTILAWQHYNTILSRMEGMAVTAEMISRFRTAKQQTQIKKDLLRGKIDIIVGTHRLIGKDIEFKDLGLLIIDEEQRFGVAQKEKIKENYSDVDVLTLTATPIPRTLNMSMAGLRDMSSLEEAPQDRHPIQTYVLEYDRGIILDAIRKELGRGGQVYYLYNNVATISRIAAKLKEDLPDAEIRYAHGQMSEEELTGVWKSVIDGQTDILVCTTIIETGIDVSNVNTLIIENADRYGLSQLHQLRGRVGRSSRRAYAYLTFKTGKALTDIAYKRLEAIREFTEFGSGFRIAMRDLEIRGAGNILGGEQHGHMEAVGYDLYIKMLADAVASEKGEAPKNENECMIDLQIPAHIPEAYIEYLPARLSVYRRIADVKTEEDAADVTDELIDRFGDPPKSVMGLLDIALLRNKAAENGIYEINDRNGQLILYINNLDMEKVSKMAASMKGRVLLSAGEKPYLSVRMNKGTAVLDVLKEALLAYCL